MSTQPTDMGSEHMFAYVGRLCKLAPRTAWQRRSSLLAVGLALTLTACGGSSDGDPEAPPASPEAQAANPDVEGADPEALAVIEGWSETLAGGDEAGAAEFFALPSIAENGPTIRIRTRADAIAFNRALPCGARVIAAETTGSLTTATFLLGDRPGGDCGAGTGGTAATSFLIEDGKIVEWRRVGTDPGGSAPEQSAT